MFKSVSCRGPPAGFPPPPIAAAPLWLPAGSAAPAEVLDRRVRLQTKSSKLSASQW